MNPTKPSARPSGNLLEPFWKTPTYRACDSARAGRAMATSLRARVQLLYVQTGGDGVGARMGGGGSDDQDASLHRRCYLRAWGIPIYSAR